MASDGARISVIWCTGNPVIRQCAGRGLPFLETLDTSPEAVDLEWLASGRAPFLALHSTTALERQLGVIESAWLEDGIGKAIIRLSPRRSLAPIIRDIRAGILANVSCGYVTDRRERIPSPSCHPAYITRRWRPTEVSLVPQPADPACRVLP